MARVTLTATRSVGWGRGRIVPVIDAVCPALESWVNSSPGNEAGNGGVAVQSRPVVETMSSKLFEISHQTTWADGRWSLMPDEREIGDRTVAPLATTQHILDMRYRPLLSRLWWWYSLRTISPRSWISRLLNAVAPYDLQISQTFNVAG